MRPRELAAATLALFLAGPAAAQTMQHGERVADAPAGSVRLFVSGALRAPVEAVRAQAQAAAGHPLVIQYSESRILQRDIEAGQPFEVALLTHPVIADMIAKGRVRAGSEVDLASVSLGMTVRGDVAKPDISDPDKLRAVLLGAKAIHRFYRVGASVPGVEAMLATFGVGDTLKERTVALGTGHRVTDVPLAPGEYELIVNLASEVVPLKGWTYLGMVPARFRAPVVVAAGVGASASDAGAAARLIAFLRSPAFAPALASNAMERIAPTGAGR